MPEIYVKRPIPVEVMQWTPTTKKDVISWVESHNGTIEQDNIKTLEGMMHISNNDWVIRGPHGEFYPCKPDIFKETYKKQDTTHMNESIERHHLPQIASAQLPKFKKYLFDNGVKSKLSHINSDQLKPVQRNVNKEKVKKFLHDDTARSIPVVVSKTGHVIDGHHRWLANKILKQPTHALVCNAETPKLVELGHNFGPSFTKTVAEAGDTSMIKLAKLTTEKFKPVDYDSVNDGEPADADNPMSDVQNNGHSLPTTQMSNYVDGTEQFGSDADKGFPNLKDIVGEIIRKKGSKYCVHSKHTGRNLGCAPSKSGAKKRERQIQYFKHLNK